MTQQIKTCPLLIEIKEANALYYSKGKQGRKESLHVKQSFKLAYMMCNNLRKECEREGYPAAEL